MPDATKLPWLIREDATGEIVGAAKTEELADYFKETLDGAYTIEKSEDSEVVR